MAALSAVKPQSAHYLDEAQPVDEVAEGARGRAEQSRCRRRCLNRVVELARKVCLSQGGSNIGQYCATPDACQLKTLRRNSTCPQMSRREFGAALEEEVRCSGYPQAIN